MVNVENPKSANVEYNLDYASHAFQSEANSLDSVATSLISTKNEKLIGPE